MLLKNKVAIITGGARGIGKAISLALAKQGANIVVNYHNSSKNALELVEEIKTLGQEAIAIKANVSNFNEAKMLIDETINTFGKIDILINNAGITDDSLILRMKEEQFDSVINTNLKGVFNTSKHASRYILKSEQGRIVNISSVAGVIGNIGQVNYSAAKAGVIGFTKALAKELASRNVTVNAIAPGFIKTDMTDKLDESIKKLYEEQIPLKRYGTVDDIANLVLFLVSESANYITGQTIVCDGGLSM